METLDIIDINDNVIGYATREECHTNPNLIHHTVQFTLYDPESDKVLFTQRSFTKSHDAGKYCFLGEHILKGESYLEALKRGCVEELDVEIVTSKEFAHQMFRYDKQTELVRFFIGVWNGKEPKFAVDEFESIFWVALNNLHDTGLDLSEMAIYWLDHVDWKDVHNSFSKGLKPEIK